MSKYIKLEDAISKIVNTPTRVITDDLAALADRQHEIIDMLSDLPTIEFSEDCISREYMKSLGYINKGDFNSVETIREWIDNAPSVVPKAKGGEWIPCSERLPEDIRPVLVTWKNTDPASYYQYIVGKHFIGTAHYHRGKWYWYSSVTEDLLAEYGKCDSEEFDEAIEAVAWMPLPEPWKGADDE